MTEHESQKISARYQRMEQEREPYLERARVAATVTDPVKMLPQAWTSASRTLETPYQSMGARGLTSLSSKLLLSLFPPSHSFFRFRVDEVQLQAIAETPDKLQQIKTEIEQSLATVEDSVHRELEIRNLRPWLNVSLTQLLLAGNVLFHMPEKGSAQAFRLDSYVVDRNPLDGETRLIIVKERVDQELVAGQKPLAAEGTTAASADQKIDLYTVIEQQADGSYDQWQETDLGPVEIDGKSTRGPIKGPLPWLPLRLEPIQGENYGYGYVSQLLGDLLSLDGLMELMVEGAAAAAKVLVLVDPTGTTSLDDVAMADNLSVRPGKATEVEVVSLGNKAFDFRVTFDMVASIQERLSAAFLLNTSIQRQAERVTAEEIRFMAQELEGVLAGTYSLLSSEFQLPLVDLLIEQRGIDLPEAISPSVVTGIEALGRGADLARLDEFIAGPLQMFGEAAFPYINIGEYIARRGNKLGAISEGLVRSEEEVAEIRAAQQRNELMSQVAPEAAKQIGQAAQNQQQQS